MDYASAYPWAKKDLLKETFVFTTPLKIRELRESGCLRKAHERLVKVVECEKNEPFYTTLITKVKLRLPLSVFEKELLNELNVAPAQLHPNN